MNKAASGMRSPRHVIGAACLAGSVIVLVTLAVACAQDAPAQPAEDGAAPSGAGGQGGAAAATTPKPPSANVRIVFKVVPATKATVTWGKKKLGLIKPKAPLTVYRPRDSGPLDVVVRAENCLPVHTRAYTFTDTTVAVRVTPVEKKNTIYGYREELPPEADGGVPPGTPDGGVGAAAAPLPTTNF